MLRRLSCALNSLISVGWKISLGHTDFLVKVESIWVQELDLALSLREDVRPNTLHKTKQSPYIKSSTKMNNRQICFKEKH